MTPTEPDPVPDDEPTQEHDTAAAAVEGDEQLPDGPPPADEPAEEPAHDETADTEGGDAG